MVTGSRLGFSSLVVALLAFWLAPGCQKSPTPPGPASATSNAIPVGFVGSMTGPEATFGQSSQKGVDLAIKQINATGGIKGRPLQVFSLDNRGISEEAATAITKLITQNKVVAVIGEIASSRSIAMAPIAQNYKVPLISPGSTNPKVTELGDYVFRACFLDPFQGTVMAKFAKDQLKATKVAVLRDVKNDYSVGLANFFSQTFVKNGGQIVVDQSYSAGDIDFKSQLTSIRAKNPEAIFVPGYYTDVGLIARQARELGIKVPLLGGDGWDSPKLAEIGGKAVEGSYFSNHYSPEDKASHVQAFIAKFKEAYGEVPDAMAALGYDSAMILADAMSRSTTLESKDIRDAVATTKNLLGVTGTITLDKNRNPVKSAVVLKVEGGLFKYQVTVEP